MAQGDDNKPTAEEKGKGKVTTTDADGLDKVNGIEDPKKEIPGKTLKDGEKPEIGMQLSMHYHLHDSDSFHSCRRALGGGSEAEERARYAC
jgi:hypothetical protein